MIDVHPPEHTPHSWRDFFIHIATIVVGLCIAVGLEQTVEFFHHRHQRAELREALRQDNEKALRDDKELERERLAYVLWLTERMNDVTLALHSSGQAHDVAYVALYFRSLPVDSNWNAARSSNLVEVLPQQDITAYAEISDLIDSLSALYRSSEFGSRRVAFEQRFQDPSPGGGLDFSTATRQDLMQDLSLLSEERTNTYKTYESTLYLRGCLSAVLRGERNLDRIEDDENQVEAEGMQRLSQKTVQDGSPPKSAVPRQGSHS